MMKRFAHLVTSQPVPYVTLVQLNRPKLNALNGELMGELKDMLSSLRHDATCRSVILTGNSKAFAAGADVKEMAGHSAESAKSSNFLQTWDAVDAFPKPIIAAVQGFALGGGCELAMKCDIILANRDAVFGQPEVTLGVVPGAGGTQRLVRAVGKSRAMEIILSGRTFTATEAAEWGLVSRVCQDVQQEAVELAQRISSNSGSMHQQANRSKRSTGSKEIGSTS